MADCQAKNGFHPRYFHFSLSQIFRFQIFLSILATSIGPFDDSCNFLSLLQFAQKKFFAFKRNQKMVMSWVHFATLLFGRVHNANVPPHIEGSLSHPTEVKKSLLLTKLSFGFLPSVASIVQLKSVARTAGWVALAAPRALLATSHSLRRRTHQPPILPTLYIHCCAPG